MRLPPPSIVRIICQTIVIVAAIAAVTVLAYSSHLSQPTAALFGSIVGVGAGAAIARRGSP